MRDIKNGDEPATRQFVYDLLENLVWAMGTKDPHKSFKLACEDSDMFEDVDVEKKASYGELHTF